MNGEAICDDLIRGKSLSPHTGKVRFEPAIAWMRLFSENGIIV